MSNSRKASSALISVFHKEGLEPIVRKLHQLGISLYSTGGTQAFISDLGIPVTAVEDLTGYPSILGGRVKTLHPKVFGGILGRREESGDREQLKEYEIPSLDIVVVDLYPFEKTVASSASEQEIIEKIDIGGISLIRAAAKNFKDVLCVSSMKDYGSFLELLESGKGESTLADRQQFAARAFDVSSHYDAAIFSYFNRRAGLPAHKVSAQEGRVLRYGENPHQEGVFYGDFDGLFEQLHGKELSYNNLLDIDAAVNLMAEFREEDPTFAILKHNNACGLATRPTLKEAYTDALAGDPVSAFGGILISNRPVDADTAEKIHELFCEVVIAPQYEEKALEILKGKKNRILLVQKHWELPETQIRTCLNGLLYQEKDLKTDLESDLGYATVKKPSDRELEDLLFASKIGKHTKSNTIVLAKNKQLCASGTGQTSRVDALKQAIHKASSFGFDLEGAVYRGPKE
ncbi:MAG: bifunctional phosphoribosylaminoimidazolecarboxamide formyltransferase/IMP cyclohydrolase [Robiginitalea sp.]